MTNQIYGYNQNYKATGLSTTYSSRLTGSSVTDPYISDSSLLGSSRFLSSDPLAATDPSRFSVIDKGSLYLNQTDSLRRSGSEMGGIGTGNFSASRISGGIGATTPSMFTQSSWTSVEPHSVFTGTAVDSAFAGMKRRVEALYHQNVVGTHNTIGQSELLLSTNPLAKRPRIESASNLPIYPQRPGEKDCAHYMLTRTCKFGDSCKFDHPLWVPEGGIPDWKEVPLVPTSESLPERPGEPDCPYYLKTQKCKFGLRCKFNHPKDKLEAPIPSFAGVAIAEFETADTSILPERPSEPLCSFYAKTGNCKFGANCKFNHPKGIQIPLARNDPASGELQNGPAEAVGTITEAEKPVKPFFPFTPALLHNSKGLPIRPGEVDCPFYLKTGSCKYGATCRYNHPDRSAINPPVASGLGHPLINSPATNLPLGIINPAASILPHASFDPRFTQTTLSLGPTIYPQRPGQLECDFYMKTGECKFGDRCKFHHPIDRSAPAPSMVQQALQNSVKLTLAGLPRREGATICAFYMKTGTCKYGPTCRFDHPPPGEAIAKMAARQGVSSSEGEEEKPAGAVE